VHDRADLREGLFAFWRHGLPRGVDVVVNEDVAGRRTPLRGEVVALQQSRELVGAQWRPPESPIAVGYDTAETERCAGGPTGRDQRPPDRPPGRSRDPGAGPPVRHQSDLPQRRRAVGAQRLDRQHRSDREGTKGGGVEIVAERVIPSEAEGALATLPGSRVCLFPVVAEAPH
jgi:hypothetical protein